MLLIIDSATILYRSYHVNKDMIRSDGLPVGALYGYCQALWRLDRLERVLGREITKIVVAFDVSRESWRSELWSDYKANRELAAPDIEFQLRAARTATDAFGIAHVEMKGYEADDLIASYCEAASMRGLPVTIYSHDKDLMQLISPDVRMVKRDKGEWTICGSDYVTQRFGVPPHQMGDLLALVGDAVDNVPGVKGIGEKKAAHLLAKFGSLDNILNNIEGVPWPAARKNIAEAKEKVRVSRELVRLRSDVSLPIDLDHIGGWSYDPKTLLNYLNSMEFASIAQEVAECQK